MSIQAGRTIKIIVVDDEPISADDMSDVIRDEFGKSMNVDVRTAYNAKSVIKMVEESPCDILLSDIQMPGMTGLQMVSILREQFPDMRVLFLTGYDDFSFAYEAFRQHAVQYILKTEGDEVVLAALKKEIDRLRENEKIMNRINDAEERYTQMLPAYRRQLIMQLMLNQKGELDELEERMLAGELYLVVGLLQGDHNHHVKTKMITAGAVSQIVAGSFGKELAWSEYYLFDDVLIWVFDFDTKQSVSKTLFHLMRKARQQLEEQLKVTMFFIVSEEAVNGLDLNEKYVQIRTMLTNEILRGSTGVAIRHQADVEGKEVENAKKVSEMRRNLENIQLLVRKGSIAEAKNDINGVIAYLTTHSQTENLLAVEAAQSLRTPRAGPPGGHLGAGRIGAAPAADGCGGGDPAGAAHVLSGGAGSGAGGPGGQPGGGLAVLPGRGRGPLRRAESGAGLLQSASSGQAGRGTGAALSAVHVHRAGCGGGGGGPGPGLHRLFAGAGRAPDRLGRQFYPPPGGALAAGKRKRGEKGKK